MDPWILWTLFSHTARLSVNVQLLILLPLVLAISTAAFPLFSLLLNLASITHGTLLLVLPKQANFLSVLQIPIPAIMFLVSFNTFFLAPLTSLTSLYERLLTLFGPLFMMLEGLASLVVVQKLGQSGKRLVAQGEGYQLFMLVTAAAAYVVSALWLYGSFDLAAASPLSSTLLGVSLTALIFITVIGFALRRTNIIESAGLSLVIAYNVWLCGFNQQAFLDPASSYKPLLPPVLPFQMKGLITFVTNTLPRPVLVALIYRLAILHFASRILPSIGADEDSVDEDRPTTTFTRILLTYRQAIFVTVYSHLLTLDHSSQLWWRWMSVFFTLILWSIELSVSNDEETNTKDWKID